MARSGDQQKGRLRHRMEYALFRVLLFFLSRLSWNGARALGRALGLFAFAVLGLRKNETLANLAAAFPAWRPGRRRAVARECYRQIGMTFLELCRLPRARGGEIREQVRFDDAEQFDQARREGKGAVLLSAHVANWELVGAAVAACGHPISVVVARQKNQRIDRYVNAARESAGLRVLYTDRGLLPVVRAIKSNQFVAFLADQDAGRSGAFLPFFGRAASTAVGAVRFARRLGCPIILGFAVRQADGSFRLEMPGPIRVRRDLPPQEAELDALRRSVELLEEVVRRYPEQWFWMHRRWKTRPPGAHQGDAADVP